MISTATLRYLRIAPRKVRMVTDLIRGENAEKAQVVLKFTPAIFPPPTTSNIKESGESHVVAVA